MILQEKLDTITQAFDDYTPEFWRSQNYRYDMISSVMDNNEYINGFVGYITWAKQNNIDDIDIRATLMHDIGGLMRKDEHFLPRVSGYDKYLTKTIIQNDDVNG
jgi:hypothetical protein